jgi:transcriptional regulator with XRE-family HTH domain
MISQMIERIKQLIEDKGLQASSFADTIQVSRGTISHILNGRNEPSKDTIEKILRAFPDISSSWFVRGEGPMYKHHRTSTQQDLFYEKKPVEPFGKIKEQENALKNESKKQENQIDQPIIQDFNLSKNISKKIDKIVIFFSDKTYMTFISEE